MRKHLFCFAFLSLTLSTLPAFAQITQEAFVKSSFPAEGDRFGTMTAIDGDTMVVTAIGEDSSTSGVNGSQGIGGASGSGAAYVFVRENETWVQQAFLKASNTSGGAGVGDGLSGGDNFGISCAISGDTIAIGARFEDSNARGVNGNQFNDNSFDTGAVYIFVRQGTTWTQQAYLKASNTEPSDDVTPGDSFGDAVAIDGDTLVVGARFEDSAGIGVNPNDQDDNNGADSGAAYVFVRNGTTWSQQAFLKQSTNLGIQNQFGASVTISGDTIAVGAPGESSASTGINGDELNQDAPGAGAVYVFGRSGTTWTQQAYIKGQDAETLDSFGSTVALDGTTLAVSTPLEDSNGFLIDGTDEFDSSNNFVQNSGAFYVFVQDPLDLTWSQQAFVKASNPSQRDTFGIALALSGDTIVVGANSEDSDSVGVNGAMNDDGMTTGAAYVFRRMGSTWVEDAFLKASNSRDFFSFGVAVAISGDTIAASSVSDSSASPGIDGDQTDMSLPGAGAVYVFNDSAESFVLGDANCDGTVNFLDIAPFVTALLNPEFDPKADVNRDSTDDFLDIVPFVGLLTAG